MRPRLLLSLALPRALALALLAVAASPAEAAELTGGPLVGWTTDTSARIWVRADGPGQVAVRWWPDGQPAEARTSAAAATRAELDHTAVVVLEGLAPSRAWGYEVLLDGQPAATRSAGRGPWTFRTPPAPGTGRVTLAFGSCVHMGRFPVQPIFDAVAASAPTAFVWLGDNSYYSAEDAKDPALMWARFREQRQNPSLARLLATTPQLAQWDDHDYGPNDSDREYPLQGAARTIFAAYWPNPSAGEDGRGIYTRATVGPVEVFLLDDRTFRDPNRVPNGPDKTLLGARQRAWLIEALATSTAPVKVVATAGQFLARYHGFESWQLARDERDAILDAIRDRKVAGVLFISGDRHLAEVVRYPKDRVGYTLWDVTSSPLANRLFEAGEALKNEDRAFISAKTQNSGWLEVDLERRAVRLELRDAQGQTLWSAEPDDLLPPASAPAPGH